MPQSAIDAAELCLFATDLPVKDLGRFAGKPFIHAGVTRAISEPESVIAEAVAAAESGSLKLVDAPAPSGKAPEASTGPGLLGRIFGKRK